MASAHSLAIAAAHSLPTRRRDPFAFGSRAGKPVGYKTIPKSQDAIVVKMTLGSEAGGVAGARCRGRREVVLCRATNNPATESYSRSGDGNGSTAASDGATTTTMAVGDDVVVVEKMMLKNQKRSGMGFAARCAATLAFVVAPLAVPLLVPFAAHAKPAAPAAAAVVGLYKSNPDTHSLQSPGWVCLSALVKAIL
jgi:hypothetical protein